LRAAMKAMPPTNIASPAHRRISFIFFSIY